MPATDPLGSIEGVMNAGGEDDPHPNRDALGESLTAPRNRAGGGMMHIRAIGTGEFGETYQACIGGIHPLEAHAMACASSG